MKKTKLLGLLMTAVFTTLLFTGATSVFAGGNAIDPQLDIISATVFENPSQVSAKINVDDLITLTGAKGTGVLTDGTLVVTTTHGGVLDSAAQANAADPIQHNHYVNLTDVLSKECDNVAANFQVVSISFESPGIAMWPGNMYKIWEIPKVFDGTDAITMNPETFTLGNIGADPLVVSFNIVPTPGQVCILVQEIHDASLEDLVKVVGGHSMVIDSNALLLAGIQSTAMWMLPVVAGAAGAGAYFIKTRMNKD